MPVVIGSLDPTFGTGGEATIDFGLSQETANAIAIQPDGKIVAVGTDGNGDIAVARFRPNGLPDFSFGGGEKKVSPSKQFSDLLKNGPGFGIHTLVWSDTYNNVTRWFNSQTLREFELRIVFQLSASDSSNLIDSPLASKLGPNRAILHSVDQGTNEKFRPYGPPTSEWLADVAARLRPTAPDNEIAEPVTAGEDLSQFTIL